MAASGGKLFLLIPRRTVTSSTSRRAWGCQGIFTSASQRSRTSGSTHQRCWWCCLTGRPWPRTRCRAGAPTSPGTSVRSPSCPRRSWAALSVRRTWWLVSQFFEVTAGKTSWHIKGDILYHRVWVWLAVANVAHLSVIHLGGHTYLWCQKGTFSHSHLVK